MQEALVLFSEKIVRLLKRKYSMRDNLRPTLGSLLPVHQVCKKSFNSVKVLEAFRASEMHRKSSHSLDGKN